MRTRVCYLLMMFLGFCIQLTAALPTNLPLIDSIVQDMPHLYKHMQDHVSPCVYVAYVCKCLEGQSDLPLDILTLAIDEVFYFLRHSECFRCAHGGQQVPIVVPDPTACIGCIVSGCQNGPLRIGTLNPTSLTLATNGCSDRIIIDENGAVAINMPTAGEALTVDGNIVLPVVNMAGTQGILKLGGTSTGHINVYESGTQNFFAGAGAVNSVVTGTNNIGIGTLANNTLTTGNNTIAIGTSALATQSDSIVLGNSANSDSPRTIVIGSRDSANTGSAPTANAPNAIAIGSAYEGNAGAQARGTASLALGSADSAANLFGALADADYAIAIGPNAQALTEHSIAIGSSSGLSAGIGPIASNTAAIAIGSASSSRTGATASGVASIAVGGSDGVVFAGASALNDMSIAIGLGTLATGTGSIAMGSASETMGGSGPVASNVSAIAIGSANGENPGARALGIASIAIGGTDSSTAGIFGALAAEDGAIAIGMNAVGTSTGAIAIGAALTNLAGPEASGTNAIAIGSAFASNRAPRASGVSSIAIGSAGFQTFIGAQATADYGIAIGMGSICTGTGGIAVGAAGGSVGANGPLAGNTNAIALGSASGTIPTARATGVASIAIGSNSGSASGAAASGLRSVAIGCGANTSQDDAIILGNAANTSVSVGIGITPPLAKLDIVGVNFTPVLRFNQVDSDIANAPVWLNRSTSAVAGTPIHCDASGRFFGFTSSKRYKVNIRNIDAESEIIYQLRPVLYDAKEGYGEGKDIPGFIAEEVWEVAPKLVVLDENKRPENVAYNSLHAFIIKELQKQRQLIMYQGNVIAGQKSEIQRLLKALARLRKRLALFKDKQSE